MTLEDSAPQLDQDRQTYEGCLKLFRAIIAVAIRDACVPPRRLNSGRWKQEYFTRTAMKFLFSKDSMIGGYLVWIDSSPSRVRKLLSDAASSDRRGLVAGLTLEQRQALKLNINLWRAANV